MNVYLILLGLIVATSAKSVKSKKPSSVIKLDEENYEDVINGTKGRVFVRFFASWCPDCTAFTPAWRKIGAELKDRVVVADFDCAFLSSICKKFEVRRYPTFLLFENAEIINEVVREITREDLVKEALVKEESTKSSVKDVKSHIKPSKKDSDESSDGSDRQASIKRPKKRSKREVKVKKDKITEITAKNFKSETAGNITLTTFCVSWCQHCQHTMKIFSQLRKEFNASKVKIAWIDCNREENSDLCFIELVNGVPMINLYCKGSLTVKDYSGSSFDELKDMISSNCGDPAIAQGWNERDKIRKSKGHQPHPHTVI